MFQELSHCLIHWSETKRILMQGYNLTHHQQCQALKLKACQTDRADSTAHKFVTCTVAYIVLNTHIPGHRHHPLTPLAAGGDDRGPCLHRYGTCVDCTDGSSQISRT